MRQMKALLIDPRKQLIRATTYTGLRDLQKMVGGPIEVAWRFPKGDILFVDEEGLYRSNQHYFAFHHRPDQALAGCGVVVGAEIGDTADTRDPVTTIDQLRLLVTWLRVESN